MQKTGIWAVQIFCTARYVKQYYLSWMKLASAAAATVAVSAEREDKNQPDDAAAAAAAKQGICSTAVITATAIATEDIGETGAIAASAE